MSDATERLERLVADELGECRSADPEERLARLADLETEAGVSGLDRDVETLATLGDGTRYRLARLLAAAEGELCVCELNAVVAVSQSAVSHALADLADAGLVEARQGGRWRYYRTTDRAERLLAALDGTREGGG